MSSQIEPSTDNERNLEFMTRSLGRISCAPMNWGQHVTLRAVITRERNGVYSDARQFASWLLSVLGKRTDAQGEPVSLPEALRLEDDELEQFAADFLRTNRTISNSVGSPKGDEESYQAFLLRAYRAFEEKMQESRSANAGLASARGIERAKSALAAIEPYLRCMRQLSPGIFSNPTLEMLRKNEALSKALAGSIAQTRAGEKALRPLGGLELGGQRHFELTLPPNPVHDTNRLLEQVRDLTVQTAALMKSRNDTTVSMARSSARANRRVIGIGVASIIVALLAALLNWKASQNATREAAVFHKLVQAQNEGISERPKAAAVSPNAAPIQRGVLRHP